MKFRRKATKTCVVDFKRLCEEDMSHLGRKVLMFLGCVGDSGVHVYFVFYKEMRNVQKIQTI